MHKKLGLRVKEYRQQKGLTLEQLAESSKVSRSMISKIERGEADPTTTLLSRLAEGLNVRVSELVGGIAADRVLVIPKKKQPVFVDPETGFERRSLSPLFPGGGVDFVYNILPAGKTAGPFEAHRPGVEEYLAVSKGRLRVRLGEASYVIDEGDSLFFSGDMMHFFENLSEKHPCHYYIVVDGRRKP